MHSNHTKYRLQNHDLFSHFCHIGNWVSIFFFFFFLRYAIRNQTERRCSGTHIRFSKYLNNHFANAVKWMFHHSVCKRQPRRTPTAMVNINLRRDFQMHIHSGCSGRPSSPSNGCFEYHFNFTPTRRCFACDCYGRNCQWSRWPFFFSFGMRLVG